MAAKVTPIPPGFHTLTPHLTVRNAKEALEFYKQAFGAEVLHVADMPDGKVMHATVRMGDSMLMLNDEMPEHGALSPLSSGGSGVTLHIYTENVDDAFARAVAAGATVKMPLADQFWGDRYGVVADPYGFKWSLATRVKELSPEQMQEEQEKMFSAMKKTA
jgi:PhnB protein